MSYVRNDPRRRARHGFALSGTSSRAIVFAAAISGISQVAVAGSDLYGSKVTGRQLFPNKHTVSAGPAKAVVGPGVEFPPGTLGGDGQQVIDITRNQLLFEPNYTGRFKVAAFNGYSFNFRGAPVFSAVTVDAASTIAPKSLKFTGSSVTFNVEGVTVQSSNTLILDFAFKAASRQ